MTRTLDDLAWPRRTDRLELRRARPEDAEATWSWYRDPAVQEWTTTLSTSLEAHRQWWDGAMPSHVVGLFEGRIVATGKIERQDAWSQADIRDRARGVQAELGWVLDVAVQGRGLGTEFAAALLDIAIDELGVRRAVAACFADNVASRRVMEKIGMRLEGVYREDSLHRSGRWLDGAEYAVLASEHRSRGRG